MWLITGNVRHKWVKDDGFEVQKEHDHKERVSKSIQLTSVQTYRNVPTHLHSVIIHHTTTAGSKTDSKQ